MEQQSERRCIQFNCPICSFQQKITAAIEDGSEIAVACEAGSHGFVGVVDGRSLRFSGKVVYASPADVARLVRELSEKTVSESHARQMLERGEELLCFYRDEMSQLFRKIEAMNQSVENISIIDDVKNQIMLIDPKLNLK